MNESSLPELYDSAVAAFPRTRMRQHAVQPIIIEELRWTPFRGVKTLFIKAEVRNETRHYSSIILFKNVNYDGEGVKIMASDSKEYSFAPLSEQIEVLVRCNCPDFYWRFNFHDHMDRSLYGRVRSPYVSQGGPPANPLEMPGMCKHLMALAKTLQNSGIFAE